MITIDAVGGLQALAEAWAIADEEVRNAKRAVLDAETELNSAVRRQEDAAAKLAERVGRNVTTKVFHVGSDVIIVEHERGIRRVAIEK